MNKRGSNQKQRFFEYFLSAFSLRQKISMGFLVLALWFFVFRLLEAMGLPSVGAVVISTGIVAFAGGQTVLREWWRYKDRS